MPELRSPFARAVLPVLGGVACMALIGVFTWAIAAYISRGGAEGSERLAPSTFTIGNVENLSRRDRRERSAATSRSSARRSARGRSWSTTTAAIATDGWRVYWAYPADRPATCVVEQVPGTSHVHRLRRPHPRRDRTVAARCRRVPPRRGPARRSIDRPARRHAATAQPRADVDSTASDHGAVASRSGLSALDAQPWA